MNECIVGEGVTSLLTVFQSYEDDDGVIMKRFVQCSAVKIRKESHLAESEPTRPWDPKLGAPFELNNFTEGCHQLDGRQTIAHQRCIITCNL